MMTRKVISPKQRLSGCLIGAAIGAQLGWARSVRPQQFKVSAPADFFSLPLKILTDYQPEPKRMGPVSPVALIDAGVKAYGKAKGRCCPEDFAAVFKEHQGISAGTISWDILHTVQEILKEGMNPRLSGLLVCPAGFLCAAMPAVGAYHFCHPDYAYLDGVEIASVASPRIATDWAGLSAAAIAASFDSEIDGQGIMELVLKIAFEHNRQLFYELNRLYKTTARLSPDDFLAYLYHGRHQPEPSISSLWLAYNPFRFVGILLPHYLNQPEKLLRLAILPSDFMGVAAYAGTIAGAICGARYGLEVFPTEWIKSVEEKTAAWQDFLEIVQQRISEEKRILIEVKQLAETKINNSCLLEEKIRGCLLAGAIGNAMGSPVEGKFWWEIEEKYPGGVTTILDPSRLEGEDDNQMAMLLVETYLKAAGRPVMARDFGRTWKEKLNRDHFYTWCMGHAYDRICEGWDARIVGHWSVVTGSTVMCLEPVGIYHLADADFASTDALAIAYMYQRGLDALCASMMAATVAEALRPQATLESVCETALKVAPDFPLLTFDRRDFRSCRHYLEICLEIAEKYTDVLAVREELYKHCLFYHMIDPLEVWGLSLAIFKVARGHVREAAVGGTNIGRDSDTIAGRAAMLSGALRGYADIPQEWVKMFPARSLERINKNAARLAQLIAEKKFSLLARRQQIMKEG